MICLKCGNQCQDSASFCENCGSPLEQTQTPQPMDNDHAASSTYGIKPRGIAMAIILTIVTCGIYSIFWMIKLNDEVNELSGEPNATSGGMVFLFTLLTCGIYTFYWMYKMGERVDRIKRMQGNSGILFLILAIFGLGLISYCLMQDAVNKAVQAD